MVEDFKLTTGTFVHVGSLRTDAIAAATPVVQDALVAGQDREFIGLLAWPNLHACRQIVGNPDATYEDVVRHPEVIACLKRGLEAHNASTAGASSMRIARAMLMAEPPSIDGNELTDKGYINQRAGLERRAALVEKLYAEKPGRRRDHFELIVDVRPRYVGCRPARHCHRHKVQALRERQLAPGDLADLGHAHQDGDRGRQSEAVERC